MQHAAQAGAYTYLLYILVSVYRTVHMLHFNLFQVCINKISHSPPILHLGSRTADPVTVYAVKAELMQFGGIRFFF